MASNLFHALQDAVKDSQHKRFLSSPSGFSLSYGDFFALAARYATALQSHGIEKGDRVLAKTAKSIHSLALYVSCLQQGTVFIPVNPLCSEEEMNYLINDADPAMIILDPDSSVAATVPVETIGQSGTLSKLASKSTSLTENALSSSEDTAVILYTSGTTGKPKGVMISHRALMANGSALNQLWGFSQSDILLHTLPLFHVHGLFVAMHCAMLSAAEVIFLEKFSVSETIDNLARATVFMGVPTYYSRLLSRDDFTKDVCSGMRLFTSGSAPLTEQTHHAFHSRTGHKILERYGMTEAGIITSNPLHGDRIPGSVGFALPGVQMRVSDDGRECDSGEVGIVEVAGDHLFDGYWQKPKETAEVLRDDGFLVTGDIGVMDEDGRLRLKGRNTDLIISGGENIYPKEIELHLDDVECVVESAVIGILDDDLGERVVALIVPNGIFSEQKVKEALKNQVADFKVPSEFIIVEELPRNSMGKIQKNKLRDAYNDQASKEGVSRNR